MKNLVDRLPMRGSSLPNRDGKFNDDNPITYEQELTATFRCKTRGNEQWQLIDLFHEFPVGQKMDGRDR